MDQDNTLTYNNPSNQAIWIYVHVQYQVEVPGTVTITPPATSIELTFSANFQTYRYYSYNSNILAYDILYGGTANTCTFTEGSYLLKFRDVAQFWSYDTLTVNITSAISNLSSNKISIYPTITANFCTITGIENPEITIYSLGGQILDTKNGNRLDFSAYKQGIYFVRITKKGFSQTFKILKQ